MLGQDLANTAPVVQATLAGVFTWGVTALGSALVFNRRELSQRQLDIMAGFAAGVMIAASYWSLLAPAIEMSAGNSLPRWFPATVGFVSGGIFLAGCNKLLPHLHLGQPLHQTQGIRSSWNRSVLLIMAITLHNIPEGLAVGVAFGAAAQGLPAASFGAAIALAVGIGLQNFPEGLAVAAPLRREGMSRWQAFNCGQASALVEPVAAAVGAAAVTVAQPILPYALSFAAGAMIFVVVEELIPESQRDRRNNAAATLGAIAGFTVMMVLDVALG
jgi:zinc transporter, ZIP family